LAPSFQFDKEILMNAMILLKVLFDLWGATLGPTEFKIVTYLYYIAAATPDRKISRSINEIAKATGLAWRTVQAKLHELATLGVIEILSTGKERTLMQIPLQHWSSPTSNPKPVVEQPAGIPELILRLCGQRPTPELLAVMKGAAENDEQRLQHLPRFFPSPRTSMDDSRTLDSCGSIRLEAPRLF